MINWINYWIIRGRWIERIWWPIRRRLNRVKQLRTERDYWKEDARRYAQNAVYWQERAEAAEYRPDYPNA